MQERNYTEINSKTRDRWAEEGNEWSVPVSREEYANARKGVRGVYLTP